MLNHNQTPIVHSSQLDYSLAGLGRFPFCLELLSGFVFLQCVLPLPSWTPHYGGVRLHVCFCNKFGCSDHRSVYLHCTAITIRCYGDYSTCFGRYHFSLASFVIPCSNSVFGREDRIKGFTKNVWNNPNSSHGSSTHCCFNYYYYSNAID